jgi:hypothetical protein
MLFAMNIALGKNTSGNGKSNGGGDCHYSKDTKYKLGEYLSG